MYVEKGRRVFVYFHLYALAILVVGLRMDLTVEVAFY